MINRRQFLKSIGTGVFSVATSGACLSRGTGSRNSIQAAFHQYRRVAVVWMTKVIGGQRGQFGIDLVLQSGIEPCWQEEWKFLCDGSYIVYASYGDITGPGDPPIIDLEHGIWFSLIKWCQVLTLDIGLDGNLS